MQTDALRWGIVDIHDDKQMEPVTDPDVDETLGGFIVADKESDAETESVSGEEIPEDGPALEALLKQEAEELTQNLASTVVNGRQLRDRTKIAPPKDAYWERFGKKTSERLAVSEHKREMIDDLKAWKKEFHGTRPDFAWPSVHMKMSADDIEAAHALVIETFEIDLRDDDDMTDEDEEATDDEDVSDDDDVSEDEEDESEDESEDDSEESADDDDDESDMED